MNDFEEQNRRSWNAATLAHNPCIILSSSGTTSMPKLIVHSQIKIALHVQDVAPSFAVDGHCRTLLALPAKEASLEISFEARDRPHGESVVAALVAAGFAPQVL